MGVSAFLYRNRWELNGQGDKFSATGIEKEMSFAENGGMT